ncbi:MAG: RdgB/HAM1 family non-canonical purine NTP pyrophosphatase [Gammaproteobacteria bacterium]|nr:RdgB/HAM1 family non-canonical purine NTP pyrophosphatase [Gammaproteobacteria bacterium]
MTRQRFVLASNNQKKIQELQYRLSSRIQLVSQGSLAVKEAEEIGLTFIENALIKARNASAQTGLPAIADDSGLEVDYLDGAPGIYSSRYAGPGANDQANIMKLLDALSGVPESHRSARFQCVIIMLRHAADPTPIVCQGTWQGRILDRLTGTNGFGYDPVFYVPTHQVSAAQLDPSVKNSISHRAQAVTLLIEKLL